MLFDDPDALEEYVSKNSEPQLRKWWAQYQEFCGEFEQAEKYYKQCQDYLSLGKHFIFHPNFFNFFLSFLSSWINVLFSESVLLFG